MPVFREVLAMSFFVNILALAVPVFTKQVYDRVVFHAGISTLEGLVLGMFVVLVFDYILRQSRSRIMQRVALRVDVIVGRQLFEKFVALPLKTLESKPGAHWQSLFRDVDVVRNTLSGASAVLMADLPFAILFFGLMFVLAPAIAWVLLILLPIFLFVAWRSGAVMASANRDERESSQSRDNLIAEMIAGRTTIKALALERAMRPLWEERHARNIERAITRGGKTDTYTNLGTTLTMLTTICLTAVGAIAIIDQRLSIGGLIATNMLSGRLIGPLNQLVNQWRTYSSFKQAVERLGQVFEEPSERTESEVKLDKPRGAISVENVTFAYAENAAPVVDSVSVKIEQGGVNALVGRNGSGKTTLLKILQGLYTPTSGRVLLDNADISQFSRAELATWIGYVPQENVLFAGTVRDNIAHRIPTATDDEIVHASKAAGVHQFIIDMPDGYATEIGEAGQRLSGGQRQRISIARALVGEPPVLLLDEPSSSLDRQAEHELRKTLEQIGHTCTVVIVTHSPILLAACRDLVALDRGKIALAGPASEILPRLFGAAARPAAAAAPQAAGRPESKERPAARPTAEAGTPLPETPAVKPRPTLTAAPAALLPADKPRMVETTPRPVEAPREDRDMSTASKRRKKVEPSPLLKPLAKVPSGVDAGAIKKIKSEPSPLLKAVSAPKSSVERKMPHESEREAGQRPLLQVKPASRKPARRIDSKRVEAEPVGPKAGTKPVLRVAPAVRPIGQSAANEEVDPGGDNGPRGAGRPVPRRPHLTVREGGKKATGTNGMAPPPDASDPGVDK